MAHFSLILALTSLILPCAGFATGQIILDEVMTREEQKKTGVDRLNFQQKVALENWLNQMFVLKAAPVNPQAPLSLSINIDNGQKIQLSDNTLWEVAPGDVPTSALWITAFPVKIIPSNDLNYPFLIINTNTSASVKARKVQVPTTPPPVVVPGVQPAAPAPTNGARP